MKKRFIVLCAILVLAAVFVVPAFAEPLNTSILYYDRDAIVSAVECIASQMAEKTIQHVKKPRVMLIPAPVWEEK